MVKRISLIFFSAFLLFSCATPTPTIVDAVVIRVYATSATEPFLEKLFICANQQSFLLNITANDPDIYLQMGEPATLVSPAYQIDQEEILVVTNRQSSIQNLTVEEVQALFSSQDSSVQVWVYSSEEEMQILFDQLVMKERSASSLARVAVNVQEMSTILNKEPNSVGILPSRFMTENIREVYSLATLPVLAITKTEPQIEVKNLISCLQNN